MAKKNYNVFGEFWMPDKYCNECNSGLNQNTIKRRKEQNAKDKKSNRMRFRDVTLPLLRSKAEQYPPEKQFLTNNGSVYPDGFVEIVNDALELIYAGHRGYVYTLDQLSEIIRFVPHINVINNDWIYYVYVRNTEE